MTTMMIIVIESHELTQWSLLPSLWYSLLPCVWHWCSFYCCSSSLSFLLWFCSVLFASDSIRLNADPIPWLLYRRMQEKAPRSQLSSLHLFLHRIMDQMGHKTRVEAQIKGRKSEKQVTFHDSLSRSLSLSLFLQAKVEEETLVYQTTHDLQQKCLIHSIRIHTSFLLLCYFRVTSMRLSHCFLNRNLLVNRHPLTSLLSSFSTLSIVFPCLWISFSFTIIVSLETPSLFLLLVKHKSNTPSLFLHHQGRHFFLAVISLLHWFSIEKYLITYQFHLSSFHSSGNTTQVFDWWRSFLTTPPTFDSRLHFANLCLVISLGYRWNPLTLFSFKGRSQHQQ